MEIFLVVLVLLTIIAISNIVNRFIPFIPVPLIQVALGILAAAYPRGLHFDLNPELFFVLFIAPLLFNDGKRTPRAELWNLRAPILLLALGLVFATVIVGGYTINWMIPSIPLPAAFGLAAILSPTDVVAVSALSSRVKMPKGILRLLEGEGLMNDASGLVAFKFAIAAAVTGTFSLAEAAFSFVLIAAGGLLSGVIISFLIIRFRLFLRRLGMQDVTMHMLIQILTPFVIYLAAEEIGVSGILAVVAGGITHAVEQDRLESSMVKLQIVSSSTWSIILFILNGLVFVILGTQIPDVISVIFNDTAFNNMMVIGYILVITFTLMLLRFLWVLFFWNGKWFFNKDQNIYKPGLRSTLLISISGVRGAVTLAGSFSIPYFLADGTSFPERNLIIFLAAGVILCTLVIASIVLPMLSDKEEENVKEENEKLMTARRKLIKTAIHTIKEDLNDTNKTASLAVIAEYNEKMKNLRFQQYTTKSRVKKYERKLRAYGVKAEQAELMRLLDRGEIPEETANSLQERFNELEMLYANPFKVGLSKTKLKRLLYWIFFGQLKKPEMSILNEEGLIRSTRVKTAKAAIENLKKHTTDENKEVTYSVIAFYNHLIFRLEQGHHEQKSNSHFENQKLEVKLKAVQAIRNEIQTLFEEREISRDITHQLRQYINDVEAAMLEGGD
ncbi:Na+/H+ antiporter [Bacillus atrophaeus]|uniref:Na+/H+ antiporter n=3 Tax=Bacillus atrophaeus TaxID=1452 RepID=A0ABM5M1C2_BACA1|nr:Na+/H+ antiporter [Bacillus atrophaeus]AMR61447.1 Na+/H+ antiporter [Bacillus subtilis subsp. globigii]MBT2625403.1 Na+/H+ antiporter [Bacillus sp. ISL-32]ADP33854.1 Na+/H+ antiporter [Bacillus atrophaeus 1942]AIK48469.1 Na+/H+ antiporter [Bacillus atrophaeus subsp. globigii]AKL86334.1 YvgP [Bacillus atrophaeus UCMB-5137]